MTNRRAFLFGSLALLAAPAIVHADSLMKIAVLRRSMSKEELIAAISAKVHKEISEIDLSLWNPTLANTRFVENNWRPVPEWGVNMAKLGYA